MGADVRRILLGDHLDLGGAEAGGLCSSTSAFHFILFFYSFPISVHSELVPRVQTLCWCLPRLPSVRSSGDLDPSAAYWDIWDRGPTVSVSTCWDLCAFELIVVLLHFPQNWKFFCSENKDMVVCVFKSFTQVELEFSLGTLNLKPKMTYNSEVWPPPAATVEGSTLYFKYKIT